jgi:general secretion pathway protein H
MTSRNSAEADFTLIEIMVVLVVLGLTPATMVGRGRPRSAGLEARMVARDLAHALRAARAQAIAADREVDVTLDPGRHSFRIDAGPEHALPAWLGMAVVGLRGTNPAIRAIRFAPDGSASGGTVVLARGREDLRVGVDWLTGRGSVADAP